MWCVSAGIGLAWQERQGAARLGADGQAAFGMAGMAWLVCVRQFTVRFGRRVRASCGGFWKGMAGRAWGGSARLGAFRHGVAGRVRLGRARLGAVGRV